MVALHFDTHVVFKGVVIAKFIDGDRVVNHQIHRRQRVHLIDVAPNRSTASRIAARSTTAGTPVKSCISTRAGR